MNFVAKKGIFLDQNKLLKVLALRIQGFPLLWLSKTFNCSRSAIRYHLKNNSIPERYHSLPIERLLFNQIGRLDAGGDQKDKRKPILSYKDYLRIALKRQCNRTLDI